MSTDFSAPHLRGPRRARHVIVDELEAARLDGWTGTTVVVPAQDAGRGGTVVLGGHASRQSLETVRGEAREDRETEGGFLPVAGIRK